MDKYEIGRSIGHGASGEVFLCKYKQQNKFYVVKKFRMFDDDSVKEIRQGIQNQLNFLQRFRHPNIVSYKDNFSDSDGNLYIVMMYCEDGDMSKKIQLTKQKGKTIPQIQILDWLIQIALAIYYLHSQNIIHRDIKPQNIFLKNQRIRLGDFGIAKMVDSTNLTATCIGTPYYMSPQILKRKPYSYKSDIWSFGCIIYQMCNLKRPFQAQNQCSLSAKIWKGQYPSINAIYSKQLRDLITQMLTVNPQKRPTIVDVLNKPFLKKRVQNYIQNILARNFPQGDADDIFADTLKQQAILLKIDITSEIQDPIKKYPSLKDMNQRNRFNRTKRENQDEEIKGSKRRSVYTKQSFSLEKNIAKKQKSTEANSKASSSFYPTDKDDKQAFVDHRKQRMTDKQKYYGEKSKEKISYNQDKQKHGRKTYESEEQNIQNESSKNFHFQQNYSMFEQKSQNQLSQSSQQSVIPQQDQQLGNTSTACTYEQIQVKKQNNKYYKVLGQMSLLTHKCQTQLGKPIYRRLYHTIATGGDKNSIINIIGTQKIGYWHLIDQILFYEGVLKNIQSK